MTGDEKTDQHDAAEGSEEENGASVSRMEPSASAASPAPILTDGFPFSAVLRAYRARVVFQQEQEAMDAFAKRNEAAAEAKRSAAKLDDLNLIINTDRRDRQRAYDLANAAAREAAREANDTELMGLRAAVEKERLKADLAEQMARKAHFERRAKPRDHTDSPQPDPVRAGFEEIKTYHKHKDEIETWKQSIVEARGGQEHLTDVDKDMFRLMDDHLRTEMNKRARGEP